MQNYFFTACSAGLIWRLSGNAAGQSQPGPAGGALPRVAAPPSEETRSLEFVPNQGPVAGRAVRYAGGRAGRPPLPGAGWPALRAAGKPVRAPARGW